MQVLGHDTAVLDSYSDAVCADPALQALRARVSVIADDSLAETAARLVVTCTDGSVLRAEHDLDAPMTLAARRAKIVAKAQSLLGPDRSAAIAAAITAQAPAQDMGRVLR